MSRIQQRCMSRWKPDECMEFLGNADARVRGARDAAPPVGGRARSRAIQFSD